MESYPSIDILFVCYNSGDDISAVIKSIIEGDYPSDKLNFIVVDNNSQDDSMRVVEEMNNDHITTIYSNENLGFGRGCNLAIPKMKSDYLLLMNSDVQIFTDSITNIVRAALSSPESMIYGGRVLNVSGEDSGLSAFKEPTLLGLASWAFFIDIIREKFKINRADTYATHKVDTDLLVDSIPGCFFLIKSDLFKALNGFDERFFMYSEEVDLCRRARESYTAKPLLVNDARIIHVGGGTTSSLNKLNLMYYHRLVYYKKHWSGVKFVVAKCVLKLAFVIRMVIFYFLSKVNKKHSKSYALWNQLCNLQKKWKFN